MLQLLAQAAEENRVRSTLDSLARTPLSQILVFVAICTAVRLLVHPVLVKTKPHLRSGGYMGARFANEIMDAVIYAAVFVFMLIRPFALQTFTIPSGSMLETLQLNDFIVANKWVYRQSEPQFGDIVVFKPPIYAKNEIDRDNDLDFIKRCRGVPGDLIEIRNGVFFRNGQEVKEPFVRHAHGGDRMEWDFKLVKYKGEYWPLLWDPGGLPNLTTRSANKYWAVDEDTARLLMALPAERIPADHFLMIGDNREESYDGRMWGLIHRDAVIGKSMFVWWPPQRWQITR